MHLNASGNGWVSLLRYIPLCRRAIRSHKKLNAMVTIVITTESNHIGFVAVKNATSQTSQYDVIKWEQLALLSLCDGNPPVTDGLPLQRDSNADIRCFFVLVWTNCWTNVDWPVIWDAMTVIWRHCNEIRNWPDPLVHEHIKTYVIIIIKAFH